MALAREEFLQKLYQGLYANYTVEELPEDQAPLAATAVYHEHSTSYLLSKKAEMWAADRHEYLYIFNVPVLTAALAEECINKVLALGEPHVQPNKLHMCTVLGAVFICESCEADAAAAIKKCRIKKSFQFSLKGWMEVQAEAVDLGNETVIANYPDSETAIYLKKLLRGRRRGGLLSFLHFKHT